MTCFAARAQGGRHVLFQFHPFFSSKGDQKKMCVSSAKDWSSLSAWKCCPPGSRNLSAGISNGGCWHASGVPLASHARPARASWDGSVQAQKRHTERKARLGLSGDSSEVSLAALHRSKEGIE